MARFGIVEDVAVRATTVGSSASRRNDDPIGRLAMKITQKHGLHATL